ncbi:MAG: efflux RND transporter periplasmic adaptor subunit [Verrucomicrobiota bacterium]
MKASPKICEHLRNLRAMLLFLLTALVTLGMAACSKPQSLAPPAAAKTLYTCSMHPQILQDHPGDCPICGMHLEPVRTSPAASGGITIDPATMQNMGIRTALATRGPLRRIIRTVGSIDYDETALADVTVKTKGWIEKLFVDATGQEVRKGDPLFALYAPDLVTAQQEYLIALRSGVPSLKASALRRLQNFDISAAQITAMEKTGEVRKTLEITAPRDGVVVEKMAFQGQMADAGMKLYRLADLSRVWVQAPIYEQDLPLVRTGQEAEVTLTYLPGKTFHGRVAYVYPTLDEKTRTARVRLEFPNPDHSLKPGMFAKVALKTEAEASALLVPDTAVLRSGEKNTVFIALDGGRFEPRTIVLGARGEGDFYQVLSGLQEGERVVTSGQFLLDSESQLKEAIQKMAEPGGAH